MSQINILESNSRTGKLKLDLIEKRARRKEKVTWHLRRGCGVDHIESIEGVPESPGKPIPDIWVRNPEPEGGSGNWKGIIRADSPNGRWKYNIKWKALDGSTPPVHDPKIIVNTKIK